MPTLTESTTADPVTVQDPVFDLANKEITAEVLVSLIDAPPGLSIQVSPGIFIPGSGAPDKPSIWTMIWNVKCDATLESASFENRSQGIAIPGGLPPGIAILTSGPSVLGSLPGQWTITFENSLTTQPPQTFNYDILIQAQSNGTKQLRKHDPTIVVTKDPMG